MPLITDINEVMPGMKVTILTASPYGTGFPVGHVTRVIESVQAFNFDGRMIIRVDSGAATMRISNRGYYLEASGFGRDYEVSSEILPEDFDSDFKQVSAPPILGTDFVTMSEIIKDMVLSMKRKK